MQILRIVLISVLLPVLAMLCGCQPEEGAKDREINTTVPVMESANKVRVDGASALGVVAEKLAKDIGCFACHSIDKKFLGPSWKNVAAMYRMDPDGEAKLLDKIAKGGSGMWGKIDMPAYPNVSESDRRVLVKAILALE